MGGGAWLKGRRASAHWRSSDAAAVGGNFFADLAEDVTGFWDDLFAPIERNVLRPIGERLHEFEQHNRETFQTIGGIAEGIAKEVGPELVLAAAGIPSMPGGGARPKGATAGGAQAASDGLPVWVWVVGGVVVVGGVLAAVLS